MAAVATTRARSTARRRAPAGGRHDVTNRGGPTLEELLLGVWEGLAAPPHTASCPACGGALVARFGAGSRPVGGACTSCGSALS